LCWLGAAAGCLPSADPLPCDSTAPPGAAPGPVVLDGPCGDDVDLATRLLVTTTDFSTGSISIVDAATRTVTRDLAVGSTDAIPAWHDGLGMMLHRYGIDELQVLAPDRGWATAASIPIQGGCAASSNPQSIVFDDDGLGYVTTLGLPRLTVVDPRGVPAMAVVDTIDLRRIPDVDDNPDIGTSIACGSIVWVVAQRLDGAFGRIGPDELFAVDTAAAALVDLDPSTPVVDGLRSAGAWVRQLRRDPADPSGHSVLALSTGIERFEFATGTVEWAVDPARFVDAGIGEVLLPQSFAVAAAGDVAYVAAYDEGFSQVQLYWVGLDGGEPTVPQSFADGFDSVERTLERVGDELWYGSTRRSAPGLWVFDASDGPPTLAEVVAMGPLGTGLAPYSMVAIP
jgi:hypothetical protein